MLDLLFHVEGQTLPPADRRDFGGFYRLYCRPDPGGRVRAAALREAYLRYAMALGLSGLTFKELKLLMALRGYRQHYSNGSIYAGVRLLNVPEVPDEIPAAPVEQRMPPSEVDAILAQLDQSLASLRALRRMLRAHRDGQLTDSCSEPAVNPAENGNDHTPSFRQMPETS